MNIKCITSAITFTLVMISSGLDINLKNAAIHPMTAADQEVSCDNEIRQEEFSRKVGSTTGINLRSDRQLNARTDQNLAYNQTYTFDAWAYGESVKDLWNGQPDALWYRDKNTQLWVPSAYMLGYPPSNPQIQPNCSQSQQSEIPKQSGQISLPFENGKTWYVCQGYNGTVSHQGNPALDLTFAKDFGSDNACWAADGNVNKSANQAVLAPASGKILYIDRRDFVCLKLDERRSLLIGHIDRTVQDNEAVNEGTLLGTVAKAEPLNGGYAHIHIEARQSPNCRPGTSVPFTDANGFQFRGVGDLSGNQTHFKRELKKP